jgi:Peptidase A4 family
MRLSQKLRPLPLAAAAALALIAAPAAAADSSESSNWAGYAVHHAHLDFRQVLGTWTQPTAVCTPGQPTYSSMWIGTGGYSVSSRALEQIGTEADCTAQGQESSSAWYELVPAASQTLRIPVGAGDRIRASVSVAGRRVTLTLANLTRHRSLTKRLRASQLDISSAEWIVEAPSVCSSTSCQTLPLADFGSTDFTAAGAQTTTGHIGTIDDRRWTTTKISLAEGGRRFISAGGPSTPFATATPSSLTARDSAFTVTYRGVSQGLTPSMAKQVASARLVHAGALSPSS